MDHAAHTSASSSTSPLVELMSLALSPTPNSEHTNARKDNPSADEPQLQPQPTLQLASASSAATSSSHPSHLQSTAEAMTEQPAEASSKRRLGVLLHPRAGASSSSQLQPHPSSSLSSNATLSDHGATLATTLPRPFASLSGAQRCFTDGLVLVFGLLSLPELLAAARACRSWRHAALRFKRPLGFTVMDARRRRYVDVVSRAHTVSRLRSLSQSPFRVHVTALAHSELADSQKKDVGAWWYSELQLLANLSSVRRIQDMRIKLSGVEEQLHSYLQPTLRLPASLETASLQFVSGRKYTPSNADCNGVMRALGECSTLTELYLTAIEDRAWNLAPLGQLQQLTQLTLRGDPELHFTAKEMGAVKQLSSLRIFTLMLPHEDWEVDDILGPQWLPALCSPPHRLQRLERLSLGDIYLFEDAMQALQRLPTLTELNPPFISVAALPRLVAFTALRELHLSFELGLDADMNEDLPWEEMLDAQGYIPASLLLDHLTCTGLRSLIINSCSFTAAQAATLLRLLPELVELCLSGVVWPSLEPLAQAAKLERFHLRHVCQIPFDLQLAHISALPRTLRHLHLAGTQSLDSALIAQLHTPSKLLPSLQLFKYEPCAAAQ